MALALEGPSSLSQSGSLPVFPENFITGRGGRISDNGILTEVFQFAFVGIVIAILVLLNRKTA